MLAALRRNGLRVDTLALGRGGSAAKRRRLRADVAIVDTIAASQAVPIIARLRADGSRVITLALMARGAARLARLSDRVIAVSHALAEELRRSGIARSRIVAIAPGLDRVARARRTPGPVRVLCVANWSATKGIHTLLDAASRVPGISLDLVGAAVDAEYARRVRALGRRPRLAGRVRERGVLRGARLARAYRGASLFALPSTEESYGMALSEALAYGLPVIACDIPATREVTGDAAILVAPRRVAPLIEALRRLAGDERARAALSRRARARARALPTWERSEREFVRVVRGLSARGVGARRTPGGRPS
jgi:glycosyltransferase involved in cell wall biosynthesis